MIEVNQVFAYYLLTDTLYTRANAVSKLANGISFDAKRSKDLFRPGAT
ncbi:MAG: hypothetical protein IPK10_19065 [Bacteroidetes bacterium]|nr:hypothetical protein [Bacteroidota bacterium]